jgi:glyoxylase-like metal-dependent hydrolase (beta-lactamase superfamily II)
VLFDSDARGTARIAPPRVRLARVCQLVLLGILSCSSPTLPAQTFSTIAPGVHALVADLGDVSVANHGVVGNVGFIVGDRGVLVIDAGVSYRFGAQMMATIAATTSVPLQMVVLTDPIQEFHFGSAAFQDRGVPVLAHRDAAALIAERCAICLKRLRATLGDDAMSGSRVVVPDRLIDATTTIDLGNRIVDVLYFGRGSAPGNLAVFDHRTGVLFTGGLVSIGRIPRLRDGDLDGWIDALNKLAAHGATLIVPGHGPVGPPATAGQTRDYLLALEQTVERLFAKGASLEATLDAADLTTFSDWSLYPTLHRENVQELYLRFERADLRREPT